MPALLKIQCCIMIAGFVLYKNGLSLVQLGINDLKGDAQVYVRGNREKIVLNCHRRTKGSVCSIFLYLVRLLVLGWTVGVEMTQEVKNGMVKKLLKGTPALTLCPPCFPDSYHSAWICVDFLVRWRMPTLVGMQMNLYISRKVQNLYSIHPGFRLNPRWERKAHP